MSQHPSLRSDSVGAKHRNVFKRLERVKKLQGMGKWSDRGTAYNLPKVKSLKIKMKKV
ncbi:MAG: small basic protein, partial [Candidatus Omnitrophota bacterium]